MKEKTRYFLIWLVLTLVAGCSAVFLLDWMKYYQLAHNSVRTQGRVISKEPNNHRTVQYSYSVGDLTYSGRGMGGEGNPELNDMKVGDAVVVYYLFDRPAISILGDPQPQLNSITTGVVFVTVILPIFALIGIRRTRDRRQRSIK